jgi:hypothetical protein
MSPSEQGCPSPGARAWVSDEAIEDTRRVWSPYYGRELTDGEAVEILTNVRNLAQALVKARRSTE